MTLAAIDRLVHHATILEMNVESYRRKVALKRKRGKGDWSPWPLDPNNRKLQALIATTALDPYLPCTVPQECAAVRMPIAARPMEIQEGREGTRRLCADLVAEVGCRWRSGPGTGHNTADCRSRRRLGRMHWRAWRKHFDPKSA